MKPIHKVMSLSDHELARHGLDGWRIKAHLDRLGADPAAGLIAELTLDLIERSQLVSIEARPVVYPPRPELVPLDDRSSPEAKRAWNQPKPNFGPGSDP